MADSPGVTVRQAKATPRSAQKDRSRLSRREQAQCYNAAVEAYRSGRFAIAAERFEAVTQFGSGRISRRALFNRGNALYRSVTGGGISKQDAIQRLEDAINAYRRCIALGERIGDARANAQLAYQRLMQIKRQKPDKQSDGKSGSESGSGEPPPPKDPSQQKSEASGENSTSPPAEGENERGRSDRGNGKTGDGKTGDGDGGDGGDGDESDEANGDRGDGMKTPERNGAGTGETSGVNQPLSEAEAEAALQRIRQRASDEPPSTDSEETSGGAKFNGTEMPW